MEIIKRGFNPDNLRCKATCYHCNTQLVFDRKEGELIPSADQRDSDTWRVGCPVCDKPVTGFLMSEQEHNEYEQSKALKDMKRNT